MGTTPPPPIPVFGDITVTDGSLNVAVSNFPATQPVSGSVSVSNLPVTQPVSGTVNVGNFPGTQPISGSVSVSNFPATQPISGSVSVSNFPATQPVSGSVSVSNFPSVQETSAYRVGSYTYTSTNVLLVSVQIAAANPNRRGFIIFNNSSNSVYVSFANPAVASAAVRIIATFTSWEVLAPICYTGALYAIRNAGSGAVSVWEL